MRTIRILMTAMFLATPATLSAQAVSLGFRGGVGVADVDVENIEDEDLADTESRTGFTAGAFLDLALSDVFSIEPGVSFTQKGFETTSEGQDVTFRLDYVEVPVLAKLKVPTSGPLGVHVYGGPVLSFEATCELEALDQVIDCEDEDVNTRSTDVGAMLGGGLDVGLGGGVSLVLDAFYDIGLVDVDESGGESDEGEVKNRSFLLTAGVAFPLGG